MLCLACTLLYVYVHVVLALPSLHPSTFLIIPLLYSIWRHQISNQALMYTPLLYDSLKILGHDHYPGLPGGMNIVGPYASFQWLYMYNQMTIAYWLVMWDLKKLIDSFTLLFGTYSTVNVSVVHCLAYHVQCNMLCWCRGGEVVIVKVLHQYSMAGFSPWNSRTLAGTPYPLRVSLHCSLTESCCCGLLPGFVWRKLLRLICSLSPS